MNRTRISTVCVLAFFVLLLTLFLITSPGVGAATVSNEAAPTEAPIFQIKPAPRQGIVEEGNAVYCYNQDGTMFSGGFKSIPNGSSTDYYYFLRNGLAYTSGYKAVALDGITHYFFFGADGKAFTDGLKEVSFGEQNYFYFFQKNGKALTASWLTLNGVNYYFQPDGRAAQNTFVTIDGSRYYFDDTCNPVTGGWFCLNDTYYYADDAGVLATNTVVDGYKLDADGKAPTKHRIIQYVMELTTASMTEQEKIDALYDWLTENDTYYISSYEHIQPDWNWPDEWVDDFAVSLMDQWGGNCFRYAAFFGLLVREATGLPVTIYHGALPSGSPHGWTTVFQDGQWYTYDVQQARQGESASVCYKVPGPVERLVDGIGTEIYES